jgi:hypothetical protein
MDFSSGPSQASQRPPSPDMAPNTISPSSARERIVAEVSFCTSDTDADGYCCVT